MSIFPEIKLSWNQMFWIRVMKSGRIPRHIGFIMDGNRRFARGKNISTYYGHYAGYERTNQLLKCCYEIGIKEVTLYLFSMENFKRPSEEINNIFSLIKMSLENMIKKMDILVHLGICVKPIGNLYMLPESLKKIVLQVSNATKDCNRFFLNYAIAYSGRDDIYRAVGNILNKVESNVIKPQEITDTVFTYHLSTSKSFKLELLVRTSGEVRLSDFLLWESSYAYLIFINKMWPQVSLWNMIVCLLDYQLNYDKLQFLQVNS